MIPITRRTMLRSCALPFIATLGGCQGDFPSSRVIDFKDIKVQQTESAWAVKTTVRTRDNINRGFHNVTIVGRTEGGEVVCREAIGDMSVDDDRSEISVTLGCSKRPTSIVPLTDESPCEENTYINKRVYDGESDVWKEEEVKCESE